MNKLIEEKFAECIDLEKVGKLLQKEQVKMLETYSWALTIAQAQHVKKWTDAMLIRRCASLKALDNKPVADPIADDEEKGAPAKKKVKGAGNTTLGSASASSSCSATPKAAFVAPKTAAPKPDPKCQAHHQKMLKMFG